jgi:hypothetical protein
MRLALALGCAAAAIFASTASAAPAPHFTAATPAFQSPAFTISFSEKGVGHSQPVRYELHGMRRTVYECADASNSIEINGPILDNASGGPFGSTPVTITTASSKSGVAAGSIVGQPFPALQFNGSSWVPLTCTDGTPPVMTADQFYGQTFELLSVLDTTNNVRATVTGVFGFCHPVAYGCL